MQRADKRKYHYIYKITRDDGRYYIGMHSTDNLDDGYFGSGKRITRSIKKHGKERHKKEILEFLPSRVILKDREKQLISEEIRADPMCMNIAPGGDGGFRSKEHEISFRASASRGGKTAGPITGKIAGKKTGRANLALIKSRWTQHNWKGRRHSLESRLKISASMKGNGAGKNNSQFGTCWVTKNGKPEKIKRDKLQEYIVLGYVPGRKTIL